MAAPNETEPMAAFTRAAAAEVEGALERRPIAEQVAARLMSMIKSGLLKPRDRLPTEAQMSIAFACSRPPLREALRALTLMGILESRQGGGYTVTDLSPGRLGAQLNIMMAVAPYDAQQHFEARAAVDLELVRLCVRRARPEQRRRILTLAVDGRAFERDPMAFRLLDLEFHQQLNAGADNPVLSMVAQNLYDIELDVRRRASELPGVIARSVAQHVAIAEAVVDGREEDAVAAARAHLEHVRDSTLEILAATEAG